MTSTEEFVRVWQASKSAKEVAQVLGCDKSAVHARASYLRKKGVKLKAMNIHRGPHQLDVEALNRIIANGSKETPEA